MKSVVGRAAFAILAACATAPATSAAPHPIVDRVYHCTLIARAQDLAPLGTDGFPSINAYGQVAFATRSPEAVYDSEIRVGYGDEANGVPQTRRVARGSLAGSAPFLTVFGASIDNSGRVVFMGEGFLPSFLGRGIFRVPHHAWDGSVPTPLVETNQSSPASPFVGFLGLPIAGTHDVMFSASYFVNGAPPQRTGLFRNEHLEVDGQADEYVFDAGPSRAYAHLRDAGTFPNQTLQLFLRTQQVDSVPFETGWISGLSVATNVSGSVSYGRFQGSGFEVRVWAGVPQVYVDSDDDALFAANSAAFDVPTSINPYGEVALVAGDGSYSFRRVFMADGAVIHRVLCENDGIFAANVGARAINAAGQIAFLGTDGGGQAVVARADPLQGLPVSCTGRSAGTPCDDGDPETAARCTAGGQCVGEAVVRPTSCLLEPDDTPCDDGDPETLAYCENSQCVAVPLTVPEPAARASLLLGVAALARWARRR